MNGKNLPMVYALLPNKQETTYNIFFSIIKEEILTDPKSITTDFEKAALNAIKNNFINTEITGCYFHLIQNIWKHVQLEKLTTEFVGSSEFRLAFKYLKALPFVPIKDIIVAFKEICSAVPDSFVPILSYFEEHYIGKIENEKKKLRRVPFFPIPLWNVYNRVIAGLPRTNNSVEAWHKAFELGIQKHPTVNKLTIFFIKLKNHLKSLPYEKRCTESRLHAQQKLAKKTPVSKSKI